MTKVGNVYSGGRKIGELHTGPNGYAVLTGWIILAVIGGLGALIGTIWYQITYEPYHPTQKGSIQQGSVVTTQQGYTYIFSGDLSIRESGGWRKVTKTNTYLVLVIKDKVLAVREDNGEKQWPYEFFQLDSKPFFAQEHYISNVTYDIAGMEDVYPNPLPECNVSPIAAYIGVVYVPADAEPQSSATPLPNYCDEGRREYIQTGNHVTLCAGEYIAVNGQLIGGYRIFAIVVYHGTGGTIIDSKYSGVFCYIFPTDSGIDAFIQQNKEDWSAAWCNNGEASGACNSIRIVKFP